MSELNVGGGLFVKNKFKTLEEAVRQAHTGDTIIIHTRRNVLSNGLLLNKSLYLEGKGQVELVAVEHKTGLLVQGAGNINLKNMKIVVPNQANGISGNDYQGTLSLENVTIEHQAKIKGKETFPSLSLQSPMGLTMIDSTCDQCNLNVDRLQIKDSYIGSFLAKQSTIVSSQMQIEHSELTNLQLAQKQANQTVLMNCTTEGELHLMGHYVADHLHLNGLYTTEKSKALLKRVEWAKQEQLLPERIACVVAIPSKFTDTIVEFKQPQFGTKMHVLEETDAEEVSFVQQRAWFQFNNADVTISDAKIPLSDIPNETTKGDISLVNVEDRSRWNNHDTVVSDKNAKSELLKVAKRKNGGKSALDELDSLIGLDTVKKFVHEQVAKAKLNMERRKRGLSGADKNSMGSLHMVFGGEAGTGKTTVARLVARALYEEGVLKSNKFTEASSKDLVSHYVGKTQEKTHQVCMKALDGVLFIDEAYTLAPPKGDGNSFNDEAVGQLIADAENYRDRLVVILAGYEDDMRDFFNRGNEGLKSRFTNWIVFPNYTDKELGEILDFQVKHQGSHFESPKANQLAKYAVNKLVGMAKRGSGNGRAVRNFVQKLDDARSSRLSKLGSLSNLSNDQLATYTLADVQMAYQTAARQAQVIEKGSKNV